MRTGPQRFTSFANPWKSAIASRLLPERCWRKVYREQKGDWLRLAKTLPHFEHFDGGPRSMFNREVQRRDPSNAAPSYPRESFGGQLGTMSLIKDIFNSRDNGTFLGFMVHADLRSLASS